MNANMALTGSGEVWDFHKVMDLRSLAPTSGPRLSNDNAWACIRQASASQGQGLVAAIEQAIERPAQDSAWT